MFHGALLVQIGGTTGGWTGVGCPGSRQPDWLGSGEGLCLIDLVRVVDTKQVYDSGVATSSLQPIPLPIF